MNAASLALCRELYKLSGWETPYFYTEEVNGQDSEYQHIRYDLGYILRQLPYVSLAKIKRGGYRASYIKGKRPNHTMVHIVGRADTPEDAAAKLCIELFSQGILKPEEAK